MTTEPLIDWIGFDGYLIYFDREVKWAFGTMVNSIDESWLKHKGIDNPDYFCFL